MFLKGLLTHEAGSGHLMYIEIYSKEQNPPMSFKICFGCVEKQIQLHVHALSSPCGLVAFSTLHLILLIRVVDFLITTKERDLTHPVWVVDDDGVCVSEVDAQSSCSRTQKKDVAVWALSKYSQLQQQVGGKKDFDISNLSSRPRVHDPRAVQLQPQYDLG